MLSLDNTEVASTRLRPLTVTTCIARLGRIEYCVSRISAAGRIRRQRAGRRFDRHGERYGLFVVMDEPDGIGASPGPHRRRVSLDVRYTQPPRVFRLPFAGSPEWRPFGWARSRWPAASLPP